MALEANTFFMVGGGWFCPEQSIPYRITGGSPKKNPAQIGGQAALQLVAFGFCLEVQQYKRE
jgi:hypothetical protein